LLSDAQVASGRVNRRCYWSGNCNAEAEASEDCNASDIQCRRLRHNARVHQSVTMRANAWFVVLGTSSACLRGYISARSPHVSSMRHASYLLTVWSHKGSVLAAWSSESEVTD